MSSRIIKNRNAISFDYLPDTIPVRNADYEEILEKFGEQISYGERFFYYLTGPTGTGKTLIAKKVMGALKSRHTNLLTIYKNCALSAPYTVAGDLYLQLMKDVMHDPAFDDIGYSARIRGVGGDVYMREILSILSRSHLSLFLVLDDINDNFMKEDKLLFYSLSRPSEFVKSGYAPPIYLFVISNNSNVTAYLTANVRATIQDTPEHKKRIEGYTEMDLVEIIRSRVSEALYSDVISDDLIRIIAMQSVRSGFNARYAIQMLSDAANIAEKKGRSFIDMDCLRAVTTYSNDADSNLEELSAEQLLALMAIMQLTNESNRARITSKDAEEAYGKLISVLGLDNTYRVSHPTFLKILRILAGFGFINIDIKVGGKGGGTTTIESILVLPAQNDTEGILMKLLKRKLKQQS